MVSATLSASVVSKKIFPVCIKLRTFCRPSAQNSKRKLSTLTEFPRTLIPRSKAMYVVVLVDDMVTVRAELTFPTVTIPRDLYSEMASKKE